MKAFPSKCSSLFHLTDIFQKAMSCFTKDLKQLNNNTLHRMANPRCTRYFDCPSDLARGSLKIGDESGASQSDEDL